MISGVADSMHNSRNSELKNKVDDVEKQKDLIHIKELVKIFINNRYTKSDILETLMDMKNFSYLQDEIKQIVEEEKISG
ncbi:hypothetical protein SDC9_146831 [bioreactor metagenome]|uniref:Uncharacterized protein n=1 Tax=bioreactor metagenome TaxID=1076179 RepID=A0A645EE78_9ZZZZ